MTCHIRITRSKVSSLKEHRFLIVGHLTVSANRVL
jgi:hypothetical protein